MVVASDAIAIQKIATDELPINLHSWIAGLKYVKNRAVCVKASTADFGIELL
jgi:hypothetical protein